MNHTTASRFPDFFVVGAPRCGTTAICRYLERNPQICFSRPKEPHYFARIDHIPDPAELRREYLEPCFGHYAPNHRASGEGSVSYLYAPEAIERILHFNPQARFIVLLRNPLEMLPSYHLRMQFLLQEDQAEFGAAWSLEAARKRGEHIPRRCLDPRVLYYSEIANYGAQVERLFDLAGREQVHVIIFDDFVGDAPGVYRKLLGFLGVDDDGQTVFERRFESQMFRSRWLQELVYVPVVKNGKVVDALLRKARKYNADGSKKKTWLKRLAGLNKVQRPPDPLTPQAADMVRDAIGTDVRHLAALLDRDLSHWTEK